MEIVAIIISVFSIGFAVFGFFKNRADLQRRFEIASLPIVDFSVQYHYDNANMPYLAIEAHNLHSSVSIRELKIRGRLIAEEDNQTTELTYMGNVSRLFSKDKASVKAHEFGNYILGLRVAMEKKPVAALLGQKLDLHIDYSFLPAIEGMKVQNGSVRMTLTCRMNPNGGHATYAERD